MVNPGALMFRPAALVAAVILTCLALPAVAGGPVLDGQILSSMGGGSYTDRQMITDDFDGDGWADIAVASEYTDGVHVGFGRGDGRIMDEVRYDVYRARHLASADLDGDGDPDLLATSYTHAGTEEFTILLNDGSGVFATVATYDTGVYPHTVVVGDLDEDGIPDAVVAITIDDSLEIYFGHGDGTFEPPVIMPAGDSPGSMALTPLDADDHLDLAVVNRAGNDLYVFLGDGSGGFAAPMIYAAGDEPHALDYADLDGDGDTDLVVVNYHSGQAAVLLGNGDGTFNDPVIYEVDEFPQDVALGDIDGDLVPDMVIAQYNDPWMAILRGNGDGSFGDMERIRFAPDDASYHSTARGVALPDLDGDGVLDVAAGCGSVVRLFVNHGDGTFPQWLEFPCGEDVVHLDAGDVDGDGDPDLVTANHDADTISILAGDGAGNFGPPVTIATGNGPRSAVLDDLDGDGDLYCCAVFQWDSQLRILPGNGDGTFGEGLVYTTGGGPYSVLVAELTGDGVPDVALTNYYEYEVRIYPGVGDGSLGEPFIVFDDSGHPDDLTAGDVDGDGDLDLSVTNRNSYFENLGNAHVLINNGIGEFTHGARYEYGEQVFHCELADLDQDGVLDLVSSMNDWIAFHRGLGDGTFEDAGGLVVDSVPWHFLHGDLDDDGWVDLVAFDIYDTRLFRGTGPWTFDDPFQHTTHLGASDECRGILVDLDLDGDLDVVKTNETAGSVSVLLNISTVKTITAELTCVPFSGTVPFNTRIFATLGNRSTGHTRRCAGRIDVKLAGGLGFPNWRTVVMDAGPGQNYSWSWRQEIPALKSVIGLNAFRLVGEDVTPPPYNQPPYPPAGDTGMSICRVTGIAP